MFEPFPDISERADSDMEEALSFQGSAEQDELDLNEPLNGLAELAASCLDKALKKSSWATIAGLCEILKL